MWITCRMQFSIFFYLTQIMCTGRLNLPIMFIWGSFFSAADSQLRLLDHAFNSTKILLSDLSSNIWHGRGVDALTTRYKIVNDSSQLLHKFLPNLYQLTPESRSLKLANASHHSFLESRKLWWKEISRLDVSFLQYVYTLE